MLSLAAPRLWLEPEPSAEKMGKTAASRRLSAHVPAEKSPCCDSKLVAAEATSAAVEATNAAVEATAAAVEATSAAVEATANLLLEKSQIPQWMSNHPGIVSGFRPPQNSFWGCFRSLFYLHNETVNIWGHLSVGIFLLCMAVGLTLSESAYELKWEHKLGLLTYLLGSMSCCVLSASYHCIACHSEHVANKCLKLDYLGIVFNITSTTMSIVHFGLADQAPVLAKRYISLLVTCGLGALWVTLDPTFDGHRARRFRTFLFAALCAVGYAPIIHAVLSPTLHLDGFPLLFNLLSSTCYAIGAIFYITHFPEKFWPGKFDIFGASHQIFHTWVNVAQILHLVGLVKLLA